MKTVLITGVSRGIGRATAEKFLLEEWYVIGTSTTGRSPRKYENLDLHTLDLLDPKSIENFVKEIAGKEIDVLINNAGIYLDEDEFPITQKSLKDTLQVNLTGLIDLTERLLPQIKDGGRIVSMSSGAAVITEGGDEGKPAYQISKVGVNMYTRSLAEYLKKRNITVSSMDPGWVKTDMGSFSAPRDPKEPAEEIYKLAISKVDSGYFWHRNKKRSW